MSFHADVMPATQQVVLRQLAPLASDAGHVVMSLTYFDDAEAEDMPQLLSNTDWQTVKTTLEEWVNDYGPTADR